MGKGQGPDSGPGGRQALESHPVSVPSLEYIDLMETTQYMNEEELRILADTYDSVYLHPVWTRIVGRQTVVAVLGFPVPMPIPSWGGAAQWTVLPSPSLPL